MWIGIGVPCFGSRYKQTFATPIGAGLPRRGVVVGSFSASTDLVRFDADASCDRLETSVETLVEHNDGRAVVATLVDAGYGSWIGDEATRKCLSKERRMAKRDPVKTARNRKIEEMKEQLRALLPTVLAETGIRTESSLNALIGGKAADFIDLHHETILSADAYVDLYLKGFKAALSPPGMLKNNHRRNYEILRASKAAQGYFLLFLRRSYLKHYEELVRVRPLLDESQLWIGQNNADYGLFITPRFNKLTGTWENDRSEIRHFPRLYWTIGHVVETGLVVDGDPDKIEFGDVQAYLAFFKNSLVRASASPHERAIARRYVEFVRAAPDPEAVPLLIPEFRFEGRLPKHKYRLDFTIIDPYTMDKVGYELSPWSTHGYLSKIAGLTQAKINDMAKDNFEKEMEKHRSFFKKHDIYALIYTDSQIAKIDTVFDDMTKHLTPINKAKQLDFHLMESFFG